MQRATPSLRYCSPSLRLLTRQASRMAAIFPDLRGALNALAAKVFEDRVEMALERQASQPLGA